MSKSLPWADFTAPLILGLAIFGGASLLTGCATPEVGDHVQLGSSRIALQMTPEKALELRVGDGPVLPLADHVAARIEGAWVVGAHRLVLLRGETPQCRVLQTLVVVKDDHANARPLGEPGGERPALRPHSYR